MEELTVKELLSINGGSQESYENGREVGAQIRETIDQIPNAYFWASLIVLVVFKVKI